MVKAPTFATAVGLVLRGVDEAAVAASVARGSRVRPVGRGTLWNRLRTWVTEAF
jgi:hypothetical protein